jgi:hypothetical protein
MIFDDSLDDGMEATKWKRRGNPARDYDALLGCAVLFTLMALAAVATLTFYLESASRTAF